MLSYLPMRPVKEANRDKVVKITLVALVVAVLLIGSVVSTASAAGLALAPSKIHLQNVLKGDERIASIRVMNIGADAATFRLGAAGEVSDWISFSLPDDPSTVIETITVPGRGRAEVWVKFKIPTDAASGSYTGAVYAETIPTGGATGGAGEEEIKGGQSVALRVETKIMVGVTGEQILSGEVGSIGLLDVEVGHPLRIKVDFQNTGNVFAKPNINVEISKDGALVDNFSYAETKVKVGGRQTIAAEWDTTEAQIGNNHVASASVFLDKDVIATEELPFKILPVGALTPEGRLADLSLERQSGKPTQIVATFQNTGKVDVSAKLVAEVYRDGKLVERTESQETQVPAKEDKVLISYVKLDSPGDYNIKGFVVYQDRETEVKEVSITVLPGESGNDSQSRSFSLSTPLIAVIVVLIGVIVYMTLRRRKAA